MSLDDGVQEEYDERFNEKEKKLLKNRNISAKEANKFKKDFTWWEIVDLFREKIPVYQANMYLRRAGGRSYYDSKKTIRFSQGIIKFIEKNIPPELANEYDLRFSVNEVIYFIEKKIEAKVVNQYDKRISGYYVKRLVEDGFSIEEINGFDQRFEEWDILMFIENKVSPITANGYDNRFNKDEIIELAKFNVPPKEANEYPRGIDGENIAVLYSVGFTSEMSQTKKTPWWIKYELTEIEEFNKNPEKFNFIGVGFSGIVLLNNGNAWKISREKRYEENILKLLKDPKHVVKIEKGDFGKSLIKLEYIKGKSLEQILREKSFSHQQAFEYGHHILKGLIELRQERIYHRDLHDRNVMIDEEKDRAVIIDLGAATRYPDRIYGQNRTYAGNNDLVSAAQLMYKMATGHHLFKEGPGFTCYSEVKEWIKTERERAYEDRELLESYFGKVRENVGGDLGEFIVKLLDDDLWKQPSLERVQEAKAMLQRYLKPT